MTLNDRLGDVLILLVIRIAVVGAVVIGLNALIDISASLISIDRTLTHIAGRL